MNGSGATDAFFELIAAEIPPKLALEALPSSSHWMVVSDAAGTTVCRLDDDTKAWQSTPCSHDMSMEALRPLRS